MQIISVICKTNPVIFHGISGYHNWSRNKSRWQQAYHTLWYWYDKMYLLWVLSGSLPSWCNSRGRLNIDVSQWGKGGWVDECKDMGYGMCEWGVLTYTKVIYCGLCEEAYQVDAIVEVGKHWCVSVGTGWVDECEGMGYGRCEWGVLT